MEASLNRIPYRAGVIPFIHKGSQTFFCLGVDYDTGEITDFGGFVSPKKDKTPVHGGFREFEEETYGAFGRIRPFSKHHKYPVFFERMMIIYVELLNIDIEKVKDRYEKGYSNALVKETRDLVWIEKDKLLSLVNNKESTSMYTLVQKHLKFSEDFISSL